MEALSTVVVSNPRVLFVDDDEPIRTLAQVLLSRSDMLIDTVADGGEALDRMRQHHYDAIVLDLMLPLKNGFEVIREMKNRSPRLLERTIVVTCASDLTIRHFLDGDGLLIRRILRKPFDIDEFVREVMGCCSIGVTLDRYDC